jgi:hypothetical protein
MVVRAVCILLFNPLFKLAKSGGTANLPCTTWIAMTPAGRAPYKPCMQHSRWPHLPNAFPMEVNKTDMLLAEMSLAEIVFATIGGLRGAVSLILAQVVVTEQNPDPTLESRKVTAEVPTLAPCLLASACDVVPAPQKDPSLMLRCHSVCSILAPFFLRCERRDMGGWHSSHCGRRA